MTRIGTITNTEENNFTVKKKKTLVKPLPTLKCRNQVQAQQDLMKMGEERAFLDILFAEM